MKVQLGSCISSVVALVLFLAAAVPSQATQHRDPLLPQEVAQAHASDSATAKTHAKKNTHPATTAKTKKQTTGNASATAKNTGDSKSHSGSGTGMK